MKLLKDRKGFGRKDDQHPADHISGKQCLARLKTAQRQPAPQQQYKNKRQQCGNDHILAKR